MGENSVAQAGVLAIGPEIAIRELTPAAEVLVEVVGEAGEGGP